MQQGSDLRVADVIREQAGRRPDAVALRHGQRAITYAELDDRSSRLARALAAAGVGPGDRVAHLDRTAPEVVELLAATSKIGAVTVPLNWRLSARELAAVVADSGAPVLLAGRAHAGLAGELSATVPQPLRVVGVPDDYERLLASHDPVDPGWRGEAHDPVLQMYTSGTTGVPKGVLITHRNLAAAVEASRLWLFDEETISLAPLPMFHVGGIAWTFLGLWNGGCTILVADFDAAAVVDLLERERVTNAVMVPTVMQLLCAVPGAEERDFSALRSITYGASPITTPALKAALRTFRCRLFGMYGLTETTGGVIQLDPADHDPDGPREHLLRSAGRPQPWMEMRVVDPASGLDRAPHEVGEVWMRGPNVMAGYFNRPEETAAAITPDGWLRTGDGGYLDEEGYLFLTDRIKDMIVSGGENVYPVEVEEALSQHPGVAEVTVIGVPDERWGEAVVALVVPAPGAGASAQELLRFARERLAGYKLPRTVEFVTELPRTPTGKVLKRELRERYGRAAQPAAG
jgi:long-chain acyl-CoA synthetase